MNNIAIKAEKVSKHFQIGRRQEKYKTLRDTLAEAFVAPFRKAGKLMRGEATSASELDETFWALQDLSFEIKSGEVVGIIGTNGAGKSTLLKILSRIMEPSSGFAEIYGRVGSLLEVGTGFHPELTGRENIYLNGAILGMKRAEIKRQFDEMVSFAEVEKFIDTPVKHYSSGMYLRLAFAVAAHMEPEILIVDEVLAVGDARFQKKCLNKMQDVGKAGRTVLFVSHSMPAITRLCKRAILLNEGRIIQDGPSQEVVGSYLNTGLNSSAVREWDDPVKAPGGEIVRLRAVRVRDQDGRIADIVDVKRSVTLEMEYEVLRPGSALLPHFLLVNQEGIRLFVTLDVDPEWRGKPRPKGRYVSTVLIPENLFTEGTIFVHANLFALGPNVLQFNVPDAVAFQVVDSLHGDSSRGDWIGEIPGVLRPLFPWTTQFDSR